MKSIPLINFAPAYSGDVSARASLAAEISAASRSAGFFYLADHGIAPELEQRVFDQSRRFFEMPQALKEAVHMRHSTCRRGYENLGDQTLDLEARPDLKESFYCGVHYDATHPFVKAGYDSYGPNLWPVDLAGFEADMKEYISVQTKLCEDIMKLIAIALGLDEQYFDDTFSEPLTTLRLVRYPPHPPTADEATFGAGAHTDWGSLTTLAQDSTGGLEVLGPDGQWISAPPIPGTLIVNLGDLMPRWTNGVFKSNAHRVINRSQGGGYRYSVPFFYGPRYDTQVEPLSTCISASQPARYAACSVGEHMEEMVRLTYGAPHKA
jgi:isopenicillin N synthase-like dioxygenase